MKYLILTIGLFWWNCGLLPTAYGSTYPALQEETCVLLPAYTVVLQEQIDGGFIIELSVSSMGRADELTINFFYTDFVINETITLPGTYLVGTAGFEAPDQNRFYRGDNLLFTIAENSLLCNLNNSVIQSYTTLLTSSRYQDDPCLLNFVYANATNDCTYQEDRYFRTSVSSGISNCGDATPPNDLWLRFPVANGGNTIIKLSDPIDAQPMAVNYDVYKGESCQTNTAITSCQTGSTIDIGDYEVGDFLYVRMWLNDLTLDRAVRICVEQKSCNLPDYTIETSKNCSANNINTTLIINNLGDATGLDIYLNDELVTQNAVIGEYDLPAFPPCTDAILKLQATNTFCGLTTNITETCPKPAGCTNALSLTEQSMISTYTNATTCGDDHASPDCGSNFFGSVPVQWFQFVATSSNPDIWLHPNFPAAVNVLQGNCGNLQIISCYRQEETSLKVDPRELDLNIGETYYIAVYNDNFSRLEGSAAAFAIALQSNDGALALPAISLQGAAQTTTNVLTWQMDHSAEVAYFKIERSVDEKTWQVIGTVEPQQKNQFIDRQLFPTALYRLSTVTTTGKTYLSNIIALQQVQRNMQVQYQAGQISITNINRPLSVVVSNLQGQPLLRQVLTHTNDSFSMQHFSNGIYFITLSDGQQRWVERFVKTN